MRGRSGHLGWVMSFARFLRTCSMVRGVTGSSYQSWALVLWVRVPILRGGFTQERTGLVLALPVYEECYSKAKGPEGLFQTWERSKRPNIRARVCPGSCDYPGLAYDGHWINSRNTNDHCRSIPEDRQHHPDRSFLCPPFRMVSAFSGWEVYRFPTSLPFRIFPFSPSLCSLPKPLFIEHIQERNSQKQVSLLSFLLYEEREGRRNFSG